MSQPFHFFASLPMIVGDGDTAEQVQIPLEVHASWFDGGLEVISARVTDFVYTEAGFRVRDAGERYQVQPDEIKLLRKQAQSPLASI